MHADDYAKDARRTISRKALRKNRKAGGDADALASDCGDSSDDAAHVGEGSGSGCGSNRGGCSERDSDSGHESDDESDSPSDREIEALHDADRQQIELEDGDVNVYADPELVHELDMLSAQMDMYDTVVDGYVHDDDTDEHVAHTSEAGKASDTPSIAVAIEQAGDAVEKLDVKVWGRVAKPELSALREVQRAWNLTQEELSNVQFFDHIEVIDRDDTILGGRVTADRKLRFSRRDMELKYKVACIEVGIDEDQDEKIMSWSKINNIYILKDVVYVEVQNFYDRRDIRRGGIIDKQACAAGQNISRLKGVHMQEEELLYSTRVLHYEAADITSQAWVLSVDEYKAWENSGSSRYLTGMVDRADVFFWDSSYILNSETYARETCKHFCAPASTLKRSVAKPQVSTKRKLGMVDETADREEQMEVVRVRCSASSSNKRARNKCIVDEDDE